MASKRKGTNKFLYICAAVLVAVIIVVASFSDKSEPQDKKVIDTGAFSVHFIDIGQGDCTLIKTDKGNMLIDAGDNGNESTLLNYLEEQNITELEYFVATHPHADHIGGASEIINKLAVKNVIMPRLTESNTPTTQTYENMLYAVKNSGAKIIAAAPGKSYSFGDVSFTVLSPFEQDDNLNNMSVSLKLSYDKFSFMFTGDAEKEVEEQILKSNADISADVFKLAHHGSSTSNTLDFLEAISPEYAVISCSSDNKYGHPHDEIIESLDSLGIEYYSTYKSGNIIFTFENDKLVVNTVQNEN